VFLPIEAPVMTPMVNCVTTAPPNLSDSQPPKGRTIEPSSGPRNAYRATGGAFRLRHSVLSGVHFFFSISKFSARENLLYQVPYRETQNLICTQQRRWWSEHLKLPKIVLI
jgi:hypothetical protein